jgi:hypothetical protein
MLQVGGGWKMNVIKEIVDNLVGSSVPKQVIFTKKCREKLKQQGRSEEDVKDVFFLIKLEQTSKKEKGHCERTMPPRKEKDSYGRTDHSLDRSEQHQWDYLWIC